MSSIEGRIGGTPDESVDDKPRAKWWSTALTRGHLETKLNSTKLLEIPLQYKRMLILYAKKIADEGFRAKGEGLIKELLGLYIGMPLVLFRRWFVLT
jgi:protein HIRA/HIR1